MKKFGEKPDLLQNIEFGVITLNSASFRCIVPTGRCSRQGRNAHATSTSSTT